MRRWDAHLVTIFVRDRRWEVRSACAFRSRTAGNLLPAAILYTGARMRLRPLESHACARAGLSCHELRRRCTDHTVYSARLFAGRGQRRCCRWVPSNDDEYLSDSTVEFDTSHRRQNGSSSITAAGARTIDHIPTVGERERGCSQRNECMHGKPPPRDCDVCVSMRDFRCAWAMYSCFPVG